MKTENMYLQTPELSRTGVNKLDVSKHRHFLPAVFNNTTLYEQIVHELFFAIVAELSCRITFPTHPHVKTCL
jgi:hypothetical protein